MTERSRSRWASRERCGQVLGVMLALARAFQELWVCRDSASAGRSARGRTVLGRSRCSPSCWSDRRCSAAWRSGEPSGGGRARLERLLACARRQCRRVPRRLRPADPAPVPRPLLPGVTMCGRGLPDPAVGRGCGTSIARSPAPATHAAPSRWSSACCPGSGSGRTCSCWPRRSASSCTAASGRDRSPASSSRPTARRCGVVQAAPSRTAPGDPRALRRLWAFQALALSADLAKLRLVELVGLRLAASADEKRLHGDDLVGRRTRRRRPAATQRNPGARSASSRSRSPWTFPPPAPPTAPTPKPMGPRRPRTAPARARTSARGARPCGS